MKKLIVANWKMNPVSAKEAKKLFVGTREAVAKVKGVEVVVCPPTIFLPELAREKQSTKVQLGVQDLFCEASGAYTGQTSVAMVQSYKAKWAILGHSERRELGETNELVGRKVRFAMAAGITPILCVGERVRTDEGEYYTFVRAQIEAVLEGVKRKDIPKLVIAYEPIWAIGKSADEACSVAQLFEMQLYIRKLLIERYGRKLADEVRVLYGGSVKPDNAAPLMREGGVDGLLVGSASLDAKGFGEVVRAVL
jgi:triosephosphate isomerase